jgi:hypothetical protein
MSLDLGQRFAYSVAHQDAGALRQLLAPNVSFRALTPGRVWESEDAAEIVDEVILGTWFSADRTITEVLALECVKVGAVERVGYRFRAALPDGTFVIEQQAYLKTEKNTISCLRILCSGFVHDE